MTRPPARMLCPAKINLWLHIDGRRADGYHWLNSGVCFADWGDVLDITPAAENSLTVSGAFAAPVPLGADNLVFKAAALLEKITGQVWAFKLHLEKNIPVGAGLGGGSGNAAALLRYGMEHAPNYAAAIQAAAVSLGADVPVCLAGEPVRMLGIGEKLEPLDVPPDMPAVLLFCGQGLATPEVYFTFRQQVPECAALSGLPKVITHWTPAAAQETRNDLDLAAQHLLPVLKDYTAALQALPGVSCARMSGSGSALFALFESGAARDKGMETMRARYPELWLQPVYLNRRHAAGQGGFNGAGLI